MAEENGRVADGHRATAATQSNPQAVSSKAGIPRAVGRLCFESADYPPVSSEQASASAGELIGHFFGNKTGKGVLVGIPARPTQDDDLLLMRFIREAERLERAFRIRVWNEMKSLGASDEHAIRRVEQTVIDAKRPPCDSDEHPKDESAVGNAETPDSSTETPNG